MSRINKDDFFKTYYTSLEPNSREERKLHGIFERMQIVSEYFSKDVEYQKSDLLYIFDFNIQSRATFAIYRSMLVHIMESDGYNLNTIENLKSIDYFDVYTQSDFEKEYWGSIESLLDSIIEIGYMSGRNVDYQKTVASLLWNGVKMSDMSNIKINDIDLLGNSVIINGLCRNLDSETMALVINQKNSRKYDSEFLFIGLRGARTCESTIRKNMKWLNDYSKETQKIFDGRKILMSGKFDRTYSGRETISKYSKDVLEKYYGWKHVYRNE